MDGLRATEVALGAYQAARDQNPLFCANSDKHK